MRPMIFAASIIGAIVLGMLFFNTAQAQTPVPTTPTATPVPPTQCGLGTVLINGVCQPVQACGPHAQLVNGICQQICRFGSVLQFGICVPIQRDPPITCPYPNILVPQANLNQGIYGNIYGNYGVGSYLAGGNVLWNGQVVPNIYNQGWNGHGINYNPGFNGYTTTASYACVAPPAAPTPTPQVITVQVPAPAPAAPVYQAPAPPRQVFIQPPKTGDAGLLLIE